MSSLPVWGYAVVLIGSLSLSLVLVPLALVIAHRFGFFDHPGPAKSHAKAVPYLGGAAIVVSFATVVILGNIADPPPSGLLQLVAFLGLGVLLALVGLLDDLRGGLNPWLRLVLETGAAVAIWSLGITAHLAGVSQPLDAAVSIMWVVGITNAFNLLDNMDGLSAGTAVIAALAIFGVAALQHRYLVSALALALAGCAAGFLRANFHPAKIYMGDAGSLFLGFVLAVLLLKLRADAPTRVPIAVILAIPGVAIFDTTLVTVSRIAHRRSPFQGGQDHTSHRLVRLGLPVPVAVATIYAAGAVLGGAALLMSQLGPPVRIAGVVGLVAGAVIVAVPLARAPVYGPAQNKRGTTLVTPPQAEELEALPAGQGPTIRGHEGTGSGPVALSQRGAATDQQTA
jgi:UDP-GlcNAc:undecaprenyl-phosphate/decaprenyl-phosphate GlcNAc-1-phosphate transferase